MTSPVQPAGGQPAFPPFKAIDIDAVNDEMFKFTSEGLDLAEKDLDRLPGLVAANKRRIRQDVDAIQGMNPVEQAAAVRHGLASSLNAFGDAQGTIGDSGSASRNKVAVTVARDSLAHQDQARKNLSYDLQQTPQYQMGLDGAGVAKLMIGNTIGQNVSNRNEYLAAVGQLNFLNAQGAQQTAALGNAALSAYGAYQNYSNKDTSQYGYGGTG